MLLVVSIHFLMSIHLRVEPCSAAVHARAESRLDQLWEVHNSGPAAAQALSLAKYPHKMLSSKVSLLHHFHSFF